MSLSLVLAACLVTTAAAQTTESNSDDERHFFILSCGAETYYGSFGVISTPNYTGSYDNMLNCDYNVIASEGDSVTFIFNSFHVESGDLVTISCPTNSSFPPQQYSGHTVPDSVSIPWCSHGLVNFRTDNSGVSTGFNLDYYVSEGGCGNTLVTGVSGNLTSTNWPSPYGYNQSCLNIISLPQQSTVHIHFRYFDLESCCDCDWLKIRCLDNSEDDPMRFCGNNDNHMLYVYRCSLVLLWFKSDDANNYPGFYIEYNLYPEGGCGATSYYGPAGVIVSPNYPGTYYDNQECNYDLYSSAGSSLLFVFKELKAETNVDFVTISCPTNSSFIPQRYSGMFLPAPVSVPWCSQGRVNFRTDFAIASTGFRIDYRVSVGGAH